MGSYETTCALPKAGKVTQQSFWDFNSVMWHPSDKQAGLHYQTCGDQAMFLPLSTGSLESELLLQL